jgi:hypothetical protein
MEKTSDSTKKSTVPAKWQIENLIKSAMSRTKDRFLSFILGLVLCLFMLIAGLVIPGVIGAILIGISYLAKNWALMGFFITVLVIVIILVESYIGIWGNLALTKIMTQESKTDLTGAFKKVRPLIWGFFGVKAMAALFIYGLLPFIVLSFGIVGILWWAWMSFIQFAYLEEQRKGLHTVWYSRDLFNQKFWPILGRILLVNSSLLLFQIILNSVDNNVFKLLTGIFYFITTPFIISYNYEIYRNLDHSAEGKKSTPWIVASIVGWIIMIAVLILSFHVIVKKLPELIQKNNRIRHNQKVLPNYVPSDRSPGNT